MKRSVSFNENEPENKKQKISFQDIPLHPQGIQPLGNIYFDNNGYNKSQLLRQGLGILNLLQDDHILIFLSYLDIKTLLSLGLTSKILYIFTRDECIWKSLVLNEYKGKFSFYKTWRETFIKTYLRSLSSSFIYKYNKTLSFNGLYSDILYESWRYSYINLEEFALNENIDRRSNLSLQDFINEYEKPGKPVIITDIVPSWLAYNSNDRNWDKNNLIKRFGNIIFKAGNIEMSLSDYWTYAEQINDETPIYLFDNEFIEKAPELGEEYSIPKYFQNDYFSLLDDMSDIRPSYRWILIGPTKSGSTFHKDPNYTSAWNGVIKGRKKWILFPPDYTPPGVLPSNDELDVTTPISVTEWFLKFYKIAKQSPVKPYECTQKSGELLFIPNRWWHTALNLEECIAVTQNYVNEQNLIYVLDFLRKNKKERIYKPLEERIEQKYPSLISNLRNEQDKKRTTSAWDKLTSDIEDNSVFKFSFS